MEVEIIKGIRKLIVVLFSVIILYTIINCIPMNKYYSSYFANLVAENKAQVVEVGEKLHLDNDTILIKRIINTDEASYLRYSFRSFEYGWPFSGKAIEVIDNEGNEYKYKSEKSEQRTWGEDGLIEIEKINEGAAYIILKLAWYDREDQIKVSLLGDD